MPALLNVEMRCLPDAIHTNELKLATIKRALVRLGFLSDGDVDRLAVDWLCGYNELNTVPPVRAHKVNCAVA